jgi:hypothetical protein
VYREALLTRLDETEVPPKLEVEVLKLELKLLKLELDLLKGNHSSDLGKTSPASSFSREA